MGGGDKIKVNLREREYTMWPGFIWLRIVSSGLLCKHGYEALGFIMCWKFLVCLGCCWIPFIRITNKQTHENVSRANCPISV
jgi:hypothetical protein